MKKYLTPILVVLIAFILIILAGCSNEYGSPNDDYISPDDFTQMNGLAAATGFEYPFTLNDARMIAKVICPLARTSKSTQEFGVDAYIALGASFPKLTPNELGQLAGYVAQYSCINDARNLAAIG